MQQQKEKYNIVCIGANFPILAPLAALIGAEINKRVHDFVIGTAYNAIEFNDHERHIKWQCWQPQESYLPRLTLSGKPLSTASLVIFFCGNDAWSFDAQMGVFDRWKGEFKSDKGCNSKKVVVFLKNEKQQGLTPETASAQLEHVREFTKQEANFLLCVDRHTTAEQVQIQIMQILDAVAQPELAQQAEGLMPGPRVFDSAQPAFQEIDLTQATPKNTTCCVL